MMSVRRCRAKEDAAGLIDSACELIKSVVNHAQSFAEGLGTNAALNIVLRADSCTNRILCDDLCSLRSTSPNPEP